MRIFALPAAVLLAFCIHPLIPRAGEWIDRALLSLHRRLCAAAKPGREERTLAVFLLCIVLTVSLLSALHPLLCLLMMIPLFSAASILPGCIRLKDELDSGAYAKDIPAYEMQVRQCCLSIADPFVCRLFAPLLICAAGMPLYIGCGLAWGYAALLALNPPSGFGRRTLRAVIRAAEQIFCLLMMLCAGVVGRSPFSIRGASAQQRLIHTLGISGGTRDTHAPVSGDIAQGVFLCCFCCALLCFALTAVLLPFC